MGSQGREVDRSKTNPGNANDSAGGEPRAPPKRQDAGGYKAEQCSGRICQPIGYRGEASVDAWEPIEPGSEPSAAQKNNLIGHEVAQENGAEDCGSGAGGRAAGREDAHRHHEQLLRKPVSDHTNQRGEQQGEENRVRLNPGNEINEMLHNGTEYS